MGSKAGKSGKSSGNSAGKQRLALVAFAAVFVLLFAGFAIAQGLGGASVPAGDIAHISGVPSEDANISEAELKRAIFQQVGSSGEKAPKQGSKKYRELKTAATTELIESVWLRAEAENLGIQVTDKQIETELASIKKQNFPTEKAYKEFLKTAHYTQQDVNDRVELTILNQKIGEKIQNQAPPASNAEIEAYYEAEKKTQFTEQPTRDIRLVINESKSEVEQAKEELEKDNSPASWKKVAKKHSSDPTTSSKGGLQEKVPEELLQGKLRKAIYGAEVGELTGPIKYQSNYLLTEVVKLRPESVRSLAEVKSQISQTLNQQKQQEYLSEFATAYRLRWTAQTVCASGFEIELCSNYPESARIAKAREAYKSCFEANPKKPPTECPAPVEQTRPAVPGTVTLIKPAGEQLVQRPQPEAVPSAEEAEGAEGAEGGGASEEGAAGGEGEAEAAPETESEAAPESGE